MLLAPFYLARIPGLSLPAAGLVLAASPGGIIIAAPMAERLARANVQVTSLARGVPVGGELDWLDDGTIAQALRARRPA